MLFVLVCDSVKGLPRVVLNVWPKQLSGWFHPFTQEFIPLGVRARSGELVRDLKPIYTAPSADAALAAVDDLDERGSADGRLRVRSGRHRHRMRLPGHSTSRVSGKQPKAMGDPANPADTADLGGVGVQAEQERIWSVVRS